MKIEQNNTDDLEPILLEPRNIIRSLKRNGVSAQKRSHTLLMAREAYSASSVAQLIEVAIIGAGELAPSDWEELSHLSSDMDSDLAEILPLSDTLGDAMWAALWILRRVRPGLSTSDMLCLLTFRWTGSCVAVSCELKLSDVKPRWRSCCATSSHRVFPGKKWRCGSSDGTKRAKNFLSAHRMTIFLAASAAWMTIFLFEAAKPL